MRAGRRHYAIVGNGAAGLSAAEIIRQRDPDGLVTILTDEPHLFYSRPGIAYYVLGQVPDRQLITRSDSFYREHRMSLRFAAVERVDFDGRLLFLQGGEPLAYDVLLLATGASAVPPSFPGGDLEGVLTFDTLGDARKVIQQGRKAKKAVVVGGGITAMELAEGLHHQGAHTTLLQRGGRIWPRLFDERESAIIEHQIARQGIALHHHDEIVEAVGRRGRLAAVRLKSGRELACQVVGVAIGVRPNLALMRDTPVHLDKGVIVDQFMQSSVPGVFAAGDVAQVYDRWTGQHNLDILWPSAINEGRTAGYNMVDVAHGRQPGAPYAKSSPFNAALLFGIHLTVIGRVGSQERDGNGEANAELTYLSRGSSQVWTAPFGSDARSAWDKHERNSLRIVMDAGRIVGALILGDQSLADPLRRLIEHEADLSCYQEILLADQGNLPAKLLRVWRDWHQSWQ